MPNGGGPPSRVIRITLTSDDGFVDTVFTDSKGKYLLRTPRNAAFYTVTIETDNQTYGTTTARLMLDAGNPRETVIFLRPYVVEKPTISSVVDVTNFEGNIPSKARAAYKRGMEFVANRQFEDAITSLEQAINVYPQYVRAINDLGVILMKQNRLDDAAGRFRTASEISKRFFHPRMNLGLVLNKQEKYREALEVLEPLYSENHRVLEVRIAYAKALAGTQRLSDAEKILRSTLASNKLGPQTRATLQFDLGVILNRQGRFAEAVSELEKAVDLDRNLANAHLQLGGALMQVRRLDRAEFELLRAYELGCDSAGSAQFLLGHVYYQQRRFADSQRAFEQYLKDMPTAPNASQIRTVIAELRDGKKN
jgi:Flp pilus assembly protein TadD